MAGQVLGSQSPVACSNRCLEMVLVPVICVPESAEWIVGHYGCSSKWAQGRSAAANLHWCRRQSPQQGANSSTCSDLQPLLLCLKHRWMKVCMRVAVNKVSAFAGGAVMAGWEIVFSL